MKLFEKWQEATEAYNSFNGEYKILAKEVSFFLEYLVQTNDSFKTTQAEIPNIFSVWDECFSSARNYKNLMSKTNLDFLYTT